MRVIAIYVKHDLPPQFAQRSGKKYRVDLPPPKPELHIDLIANPRAIHSATPARPIEIRRRAIFWA